MNTTNTQTTIIATLGPSTNTYEKIIPVIEAGANIVRLNFSWGTHDEMSAIVEAVRAVAQETGVHIPILQDLSGPRLTDENGHRLDTSITTVITDKDRHDIGFALAHNIEYIALSYVANADDVRELRELVRSAAVTPKIVAKIERPEALANLEEIIHVSDAIMVARGDLGQALPIEELPFLQRDIIQSCVIHDRFVIVATEMLLSMTTNPHPTRAEVNDVATAVLLRANAVMLSEETARGAYPVEAVRMMRRVTTFAQQQRESGKYTV